MLRRTYKIIEEYQNIDVVMGLNDPAAMELWRLLTARVQEKGFLYTESMDRQKGKSWSKKVWWQEQRTVSKTDGRHSVNAAYQILQGEKVEKKKVISVQMITKKNVEQTDISRWQ